MINVIAVDSLRTVPISAKLGLALVSYYILAALAFFIPVALVAAELATTYPRNGGLFIWVKEAFGQRMGFTTIWLQWIYNLIWFPTILLFIASTSAYVFNLDLAENKLFLIITVLSLFWLFTGLNCLGLRIASMISTIGAILGTLVPMLGIMSMAGWWLIQGKVPANAFGSQSILPDLSSLHSVAMFIVVIFGLMGIEMSAVHAEDVKHPKKDYPKAIFYSAIIIILTLVLSALSILVVVPQSKLSVVTGLVEAYDLFFKAYDMPWMTQVIAFLIVIGGVSCVSAWMIGPIKGLMIAAKHADIPSPIYQLNRFNSPYRMLVIQALIFTLISLIFIYIPSMNTTYWWLSDTSAQLALIVYIIMFAAFVRLRYTQPHKERVYCVPGKTFGMLFTAGTGVVCCVFGILIGFISPSQIPSIAEELSIKLMLGLLFIAIAIPIWIGQKHR